MNQEKYFLLQVVKDIVDPSISHIGYSSYCKNLDWEVFYNLLKEHHIFNLVYQEIKSLIPEQFQKMYLKSSEESKRKMNIYIREFHKK